ncbi:hypothetical protein Acr_26g0002540 [Actinidia rufa]|uniref:Uncharacterized protein n=1 Tax=Actinidia rufa TaxID=165716 RepID=A0A7J0H2G9_9ERIC|nr:hypothetical protein Acr_26g0002540 [Actinidia rufa]
MDHQPPSAKPSNYVVSAACASSHWRIQWTPSPIPRPYGGPYSPAAAGKPSPSIAGSHGRNAASPPDL